MNFALSNTRSLVAKLPSMIDMFRELNLHFLMLAETWMKSNESTREELLRLSESANINLVYKNRPSRGGGVAIAYNSNKISMKKYAVVNADGLEVVAASGRTKNISRNILVIVVYIPPSQSAATNAKLWDAVSDTIEKAKFELNDPYIILGGDTNQRPIANATTDFPNITVLGTGPTRGTATLDEVSTNFSDKIVVDTFFPLEDEEGKASDHNTVICRATLPRLHQFTTKSITYRVYNARAEEEFEQMLLQQNWDSIVAEHMSPSEAAVAMNEILQKLYNDAFPIKKRVLKSTDAPWLTDEIRRLCRNKKR